VFSRTTTECSTGSSGGYGPPAGFSARVDVAFAMGHLPKRIHRELHLIREIRNHFAHHPDLADVSTQKVKDKCAALATPHRLSTDKTAELDSGTRFCGPPPTASAKSDSGCRLWRDRVCHRIADDDTWLRRPTTTRERCVGRCLCRRRNSAPDTSPTQLAAEAKRA
jgi:hypothetical protein